MFMPYVSDINTVWYRIMTLSPLWLLLYPDFVWKHRDFYLYPEENVGKYWLRGQQHLKHSETKIS